MKLSFAPTYLGGLALIAGTPCTVAQNSSLPLSQSTTCDETCQQNVLRGATFEQDSHAHTPLDGFYSIPASFKPSMEPGTLLRVETHTNLTNYTVPGGLTMSRIMYTSQSLNGTLIPASAYVLWPYAPFEYTDRCSSNYKRGNKAQGKFPLVAWAHGTSGQFVNCAPSNYRSLQYHFMAPYTIALEGFAVVAPDYAGLGVTTKPNGESSHTWGSSPAGANDVAYAIDAVRKAFPEYLAADGPFVAMGHSQGGSIMWAFAERQAKAPQAGYRGTITISPPTRVVDILNSALAKIGSLPAAQLPSWALVTLGIQPKLIAAITTVYPSYNYSAMTPTSYDRWNNVIKPLQACLPTENLAFDIPANEIVKPNWTTHSTVLEWKDRVAVGGKKFKGPMLAIVGENDVVPLDILEQDVDASCKASKDQSLEMVTFQGSEHFPVIQTSRMRWMSWIKERISGMNANGDCAKVAVCGKKSIVKAFNSNYTVHSIPPNWLVQWVPGPQEMWKLAL
ncbi:alpha/beta-hydrolase [Lentithecium fluviatile CBS 122367]|uniref:Alpha/beta-hydrolase n=1 Tax=Lentithecium fluviatile CBS 122367 TaxID=1168545 RepID=A0A6G1IJF1_9PLEO|nr:alpha/beta-hydrolase [Lentithecium fluviatile CBS 122367]